jgi:hypothetical protein
LASSLSYADTKATLERLDGLDVVLVGGQALNLWAEYYLARVHELARDQPYTSKDIDFCGARHDVVECARRLGGTPLLPEYSDATVSTGAVVYVDANGEERQIDFISRPHGLEMKDVRRTAIPVEIVGENDEPTGITLKVMNPERCMESRVHNVVGLGIAGDHAIKQLRASVFCAREYLRDILAQGYPRQVLKLSERIFQFCYYNLNGRKALAKTGIDPFDAVVCSPELPETFNTVRYAQMRRLLDDRRSRFALRRQELELTDARESDERPAVGDDDGVLRHPAARARAGPR